MNIDDLDLRHLTEMNVDEALELIRQIRLSRRTNDKPIKTSRAKKIKGSVTTKSLDAEQAEQLLKLLGGSK